METFAPKDEEKDLEAINALASGNTEDFEKAGGKFVTNLDRIRNALASGNTEEFEKAGGKFVTNFERIRAETSEYFKSLAFLPGREDLKKAYATAYKKLLDGDPTNAIEILNEDYSYLLGMENEGTDNEKELKKILRMLNYLKHDFKKHQV
ncbi:MAG TPA: hypothetical protein VJC12_00200 [Candidatus Paceibacterota bacterium]